MKALYLPVWFVRARLFGQRRPLQSVIFVSDRCNLRCRHCCVYSRSEPVTKTYAQLREELEYCYRQGSRFVDFEGGEPTLWRDGEHDLNSLIRLAKQTGFFSTTITTNAVQPFAGSEADSIWVSLDGIGSYHDSIRGEGVFNRLVRNIETCGHPHLSVNMVVNSMNYKSVEETIEFAWQNPHIRSISINLHTPYPGTEALELSPEQRLATLDTVIRLKRKGYPIMNSVSGLKAMRHNRFKRYCWIANFITVDGTRLPDCGGSSLGLCDRCGYCMAGEMNSVMRLCPDTLMAGLKLRM